MAKHRRRVDRSELIASLAGALPVIVLGLIVFSLVTESVPAIQQYGLAKLLSTDTIIVAKRARPLLGSAIWGSLQIVTIATALALPVSLAIAILVCEFRLGAISRALDVFLGAVLGVPPIVYAFSSGVLLSLFIRPKFCAPGLSLIEVQRLVQGSGASGASVPMDGSTLSGGILLGLLIVPYIAPMLRDAIRDVPQDLREASWALGATQWYTLRRVVLPRALTGIVAATSLGVLKAMGDAVIAAWAVGAAAAMPTPHYDVFERTGPLPSVGAELLGALSYEGGGGDVGLRALGYFSGLVLLVMALLILGLTEGARRWLQRRYGA